MARGGSPTDAVDPGPLMSHPEGMAWPQTHLACPTAIIEAPTETVWGLLLDTAAWGRFYDVRVLSVEPPGPARPGQRLIGNPGPRFLPLRLVFDFTEVDSTNHRLGIDGLLPFGIRAREDMRITPLDARRCRVTYNCDFRLPGGVWGRLLALLIGRGLDTGPADSLMRLKREAERALEREGGAQG